MIIVEPSAELMFATPNAAQIIELAGRTCYKSEDRITPESAEKFIRDVIMTRHHYSVLEHAYATWRFVCDRGVTHEMVRHRIAAFSQESTRFCNYGKEKFKGQIRVIQPPFAYDETTAEWKEHMAAVEALYLKWIERKEKPEIARSILPNCLKTEIVMTCNFREWMHVFSLRTAKNAHPQIKQVMDIALAAMQEICPAVFAADAA